jgi:predicted RNase H-like nuclease (RuvC/YqgF family)
MVKLNESKKSERSLKTSLEELQQKCDTWQEKAEDAYKAVRSAQALQNTIDHLENRLEIANTERLDAEEQLFNVQTQKSPFDSTLPKLSPISPFHHEHAKVGENA